jgi:ABC-type amino acid transport substrate-binding protein
LVEGQVDVVTLVKSEVDEQLRQLGIVDSVTEIDGLEFAQTLHALVAKQSPDGQAHLDLINQGLAELMASGGWFEVVAFHQGRQLALMN